MKAIDGIHYIFDRYAFLNQIMEDNNRSVSVGPDSTKDEVRKVITAALALYHPDRQEKAAKDMKEKAERTSHLLADCKQFLLNDDVRPLYNERLAQFKAEKPEFVSPHGNPIVDIYAENFDVDSLVSDEEPDLTVLEEKAKALTQYDENAFVQMQTLYQTMPENPQIKALYKDALTKKYTYLEVLEGIAWHKVGYGNRKSKAGGYVLYADEYAAKVEKALAKARDEDIRTTLNQRHDVARIGLSPMPLLLTYNGAAQEAQDYALMKPEEQAQVIEKLTEKAKQNFDIRMKFVQDIAQQKQQILEELTTLTTANAISANDPADPVYHFYLVDPDDESIMLRVVLDINSTNARPEPWEGLRLSELKQAGAKANSYAVIRNKELAGDDFLLEIMTVANRICNEVVAARPATNSVGVPKPAP